MNNRLVIFASGWTKPDFLWFPMAKRFENVGFDTIRVNFPGRGFGSLEESAEKATELLDLVSPNYDHVTFIGHSMGGLIGRYLIQMTEDRHINSYISLATPHKGVWGGQYAGPAGASAQQMGQSSDFMAELNEAPWPYERVSGLGLQAQFEQIVMPRSSALFPYGPNMTIPWVDHVLLPVSRRAFFEMWAWLTMELFGELNALPVHGLGSVLTLRS